jgi:hypothetical protein
MADVRYADCTAAQQHLWAGRRFRKHTKVCPPSTYEVAGRPSVVWKKKMRGSNMWLSTDPWSISRKVAARSVKVEFPSRFSPPPRDRLGRGRPSPIDGRPPAASFGEVRPDQEQGLGPSTERN